MPDFAFVSIAIDDGGNIAAEAHAAHQDRACWAAHWAQALIQTLANRPDALALLDDITPAQAQAGAAAFLAAIEGPRRPRTGRVLETD